MTSIWIKEELIKNKLVKANTLIEKLIFLLQLFSNHLKLIKPLKSDRLPKNVKKSSKVSENTEKYYLFIICKP